MYLNHYGLNKKPFEISPDPTFQWMGEKYKEALALLKYGISSSNGFLIVTGDVGTGKTALIKRFVKMVNTAVMVGTVADPDMSRIDFYNTLAEEFNMGKQFNTKGEFLIHFKHFLMRAYKSNKKVLLIIDEAQRLRHELLEEIRLLSTIDFNGRMLLSIFFVGQNEFKNFLMEKRNKPIRDRITARYEIKSLTEREVFSYIRYRLRVAGAKEEIFTSHAISEIYHLSRGFPRPINIICDCALLTGYVSELKIIDTDIIRECAVELNMTIDDDRHKNDSVQPVEASTAIPVENAEDIPENVFQKQDVIRSAPIFVTFVLFLGFILYLLSNSFFDIVPGQTSHRTAAQTINKPHVIKPEGRLNEQSGEEPRDIESVTVAGSGNVNGQLDKQSILKEIAERIDAASSFGLLPPKRHVPTKKNEDAATEESIDQ